MTDQNTSAHNVPTDRYWASVDRDGLADVIKAKAVEFRLRLENDGRIDMWQRATRCYYGMDPEGGFRNSAAVTYGGPTGENVMLRVNHFHSIAQGILTTVAKARPAFDARALSTDTEALSQAQLATGVIEAYFRDIGLEAFEGECARMAWVLAEGWTALRWNPFIGNVIGKTTRPVLDSNGQPRVEMVEQPKMTVDLDGQPMPTDETEMVEQPVTEEWPEREGDVEAQVFAPQEVIRNLDSTKRDLEWVILPYRQNVWDLIARYPEHRDDLIAQRKQQRWARSANVGNAWETVRWNEDDVTVWWLYHLPTSAVIEGRHSQVCGSVVLHDGPMMLREVPCYGMIPEIEMVTGSGYSLAFDLLAICQAYDSIWDVILSSHDSLGGQFVIAPKNSDVTEEQLGRSLTILKYTPQPDVQGGGKPEALNLLAISADSFKLLEILPHLLETLSGLNSVARGEPAPNLKSGTALALVQSLAVAFNSGFQGEYVRHLERVATGLLRLLQQFAGNTNMRMSEVVGRSETSALKEWNADSFKKISRIAVEIASPLMQSEAGRYQFAQDMATNKMITTPQEFIEAFTDGTVTPMLEAPLSRIRHVRTENEQFLSGQPVQLGKYDDHIMHVGEHLGLLDSPEARENIPLCAAVLAHVDQHIAVWSTMPLPMAIATKQSVMPPPPPMPLPMPGAAPGPPHGAPPGPPGPKPPQPTPTAAPLGHEGGPGMPSMPSPHPAAPPPPNPS